MASKNQTLGEFIIENQSSFKYSSGELSRLINSIRLAAKVVNHEVNKAGLVDIIGAAGDTNIQGEDQQKLDVYANDKFIQTLKNRNIVCGIASEEEVDFISININSMHTYAWKNMILGNQFKINNEYRFADPSYAKKRLAINYIKKVLIVDSKGIILNVTADLFNPSFESLLKEYQ